MSQLNLKQAPAERQAREDRKSVADDPLLVQLLISRPAEIGTYIDANVTDLESAKTVLKTLAMAVALLARREFSQPKRADS